MKTAFSRKNLWSMTPDAARAALSPLLRLVPPRFLLGRRFLSCLTFVRDAQRWPVEQAREYQLAQVRDILEWAYQRTAYYRQRFDRIGFRPEELCSLEDLSGLPTIDKQVVREHLEEMCAIAPDSLGVDYVSTGGSSGPPLHFYIGADRSAVEYAYLVASWERAGYRLDISQAVIRGQIVAEDRRGLRHAYDPLLRRHYYSNFHMSPENIGRYVEHIRGIGPCFLHVYPSSVSALASYIRSRHVEVPSNILGILAGSENVCPEDRALIEQVFGVRYFSWYGHSEKLVLGAECEHSTDYHIWPTYGYFELLDSNGCSINTPGQRGEIVGTGFINRVVPFIRYRTGDYATYVGEACPSCGRQQPIISQVEGRWPQGNLLAGDGSPVSMTTLNLHDDTFENVHDYQFFQRIPGQAVLRIVPIGDLSSSQQRLIASRVNKRLQGQVRIEVEVCHELFKTAAGKQPRVVRQMADSDSDMSAPAAQAEGEVG